MLWATSDSLKAILIGREIIQYDFCKILISVLNLYYTHYIKSFIIQTENFAQVKASPSTRNTNFNEVKMNLMCFARIPFTHFS